MKRSLLFLSILGMLVPGRVDAQELRLADVYRAAQGQSARLRAAAAQVDASRAMERAMAVPMDPSVQLGLMNLSLPGLDGDMPTSMVPSLQLTQMVPFPGKLGLRGQLAEQGTDLAANAAAEAGWEVRAQSAMAFYMVHETDRQLVVMRETLRWLEDYEQVAKAMYSAGEGRQSDVLRAGVESARMSADIRRMTAMRTAAAARLNAVLSRPADSPVPATAYDALPLELPPLETLRAWALESRPMLARGRTEVAQAATRAALARRELWPDLMLGVEYGQRQALMDGMETTERMGSLMVGFTVPVFARQRQLRLRDEAAAMTGMARSELAQMQADVDAALVAQLAQLERTRDLIALYRSEILPQADANVASSFTSYRAGTVDFMTLVDAQMSLARYRQELHSLLADYGRAIAELEMTIGRELPASTRMLTEES